MSEDTTIIEVPTASRVQKIEFPLSDVARVFLILDGPLEVGDFERLHAVVDLIREAQFPAVPVQPLPAGGKRVYKPYKAREGPIRLKSLPPCLKHPNSLRSDKTNRCLACQVEHGKLMVERQQAAKRAAAGKDSG